MKQLRVLLLRPGRDASPSQDSPQQYVAGTPLYTWVERDNVGRSILPKETTLWQGLGVKPPLKSNALTTTPPRPRNLKILNETKMLKFSRPVSCAVAKSPCATTSRKISFLRELKSAV